MRTVIAEMVIAALASSWVVTAAAEPRAKHFPHHIVIPSRTIEPGEIVRLHLSPPAAGDPRRIAWSVVTGSGSVSPEQFAAPFVVTQDLTTVLLRVVRKDDAGALETLAEETLRVREGAVPGAEACLGPGQTWSKGGRDFDQGLASDDLASVLVPAQPEYPANARARGVEGVVTVHTLVCRTGRVLHAWIPVSIPPHPELELLHDAALEAARRIVWRPPTISGQPIAFLASVPFRFPPP